MRLIWTLALCLMAGSAFAQDTSVMARGKYLVEEVAKCSECHTPATATGEADKSKWLKGGQLVVKPLGKIPKWHTTAPDITSTSPYWERWGMDGFVKYLETGKNPKNGGTADRPMPAYTLSHDDAEAIVTYLKSLS